MSHIEAIYRHGVFEPLGPVDLREDQRVQLSIEPARDQAAMDWLNHVRAVQATVVQRNGPLPDSSADLATDRLR